MRESRATIFLEAKNKAVVYIITGILGQTRQLYGLGPDADVRVRLADNQATIPLISRCSEETVDGQKFKTES